MVGVVDFYGYVGVLVSVGSVEYEWCVVMVGGECYNKRRIGFYSVVLGVWGLVG